MGCTPSKQEASSEVQQASRAPPAGAGASAHLNKPLSDKSAFPGSFFEREERFRLQQEPRRAVAERREGPCRLRVGAWGGWKDGWCSLVGHELRFHAGTSSPPPPGAPPERSLELVGARLRAEHGGEVALAPPGSGPAVVLAFPDERQRDEWMVGLGRVPGLFRRVRDYYQVGASWGRGATCEVREVVARFSGRRLALKARLDAGSRQASRAMHNELRILQICAKQPHPAIPQLHDYFFDEEGSIELVIDLMEGGELFDHIAMAEQLSEREAHDIFKQVAEGVAHLHSLGIAHRDLKPQNLMYASADQGAQVCIMDYDLAKVNHAPTWEGHTPCGTLHYMAPEIVQHQRYSLAVDVWSLGVILFILLTGRMPFDGKDAESIAAAIEAGHYCTASELWGRISQPAQDLVRSLLQTDPEKRLTAQQVLQHPWLTTDLGEEGRPPLPSPAELRSTLRGTERGRQLLALAALACSEGDLRQARSAEAAAKASAQMPPALRLSSGSLLDFDMQPVREQAESSPASSGSSVVQRNGTATPAAAGAAAAAGSQQEAQLELLRAQLGTIGTAAGLQDRQALELAGQEPLGGSPRKADDQAGPTGNGWQALAADWRSLPQQQRDDYQQQQAMQQQQQQQALVQLASSAAGLPASDSFADLDAIAVEEQDLLPGSAARSRRSSFSFNPQGDSLRLEPAGSSNAADDKQKGPGSRTGSGAVTAASPAAPFGSFLSTGPQSPTALGREAALALLRQPLRLPSAYHRQQQRERLPGDAELLQRLAGGQIQQLRQVVAEQHGARPDASATSQPAELGRSQSAKSKSGGGGGVAPAPASLGSRPARSSSSSRLRAKDVRLGEGEREPVDLAMRSKRERLRRLATAPPVPLRQ
ncbi:hypothetical protein ABPG75_006216 [Micractinium tetrahymenae]